MFNLKIPGVTAPGGPNEPKDPMAAFNSTFSGGGFGGGFGGGGMAGSNPTASGYVLKGGGMDVMGTIKKMSNVSYNPQSAGGY